MADTYNRAKDTHREWGRSLQRYGNFSSGNFPLSCLLVAAGVLAGCYRGASGVLVGFRRGATGVPLNCRLLSVELPVSCRLLTQNFPLTGNRAYWNALTFLRLLFFSLTFFRLLFFGLPLQKHLKFFRFCPIHIVQGPCLTSRAGRTYTYGDWESLIAPRGERQLVGTCRLPAY
jgi:hypothetical protein